MFEVLVKLDIKDLSILSSPILFEMDLWFGSFSLINITNILYNFDMFLLYKIKKINLSNLIVYLYLHYFIDV